MSHERYTQLFDFPVRQYYERAGVDFSLVSFESLSERFCHQFESRLASTRLFPSATGVLSSIKQRGLQQYMLSGTEHQTLCRMVRNFQLGHVFDGIKGMSDGLASGKISGGQELLDEFEIKTDGTIMIGDTTHDYQVAQELGMDCALLATGHQSFERLKETGCPVYESLEGVAEFLFQDRN